MDKKAEIVNEEKNTDRFESVRKLAHKRMQRTRSVYDMCEYAQEGENDQWEK